SSKVARAGRPAAIGPATDHTSLDAGVILAAVLGLLIAASFWLACFDFFVVRGRQLLPGRSGKGRIAHARDVYTFLHLPMVVGIVLFAFAMKSTLTHLGDD